MKKCTKCKIEKDFTNFSKNNNSKDKLCNKCKLCAKEYSIYYREKNKEHLKEYSKKWRKENKEYSKKWCQENKEVRTKYIREYNLKRKNNDGLFKLSSNIRTLIYSKFIQNNYTKKSKTYNVLGCSFNEFKIYLQKQFTEGMNFENYGEWHLDHIYPVSLAKTEEEVIKLNHYTNFQPLWAIDNLKKGNKIL